jgi:hypothetical protein
MKQAILSDRTLKNAIFVLCLLLIGNSSISAQRVTNWHRSKTLHYNTNYDFDLNRSTGIAIKDNGTFRIDIEYNGTGKIYYLSGGAFYGNGQKLIYTIDYADYRTFTDNSRYISIQAHNEYSQFTFNISIKKKKERIIKIAQINKNHEGVVYY